MLHHSQVTRPGRSILIATLMAFTLLLVGASPQPAQARTWCGDQIASATWVNKGTLGWTLSVFPTSCGRRTSYVLPSPAYHEAIAKGGGWEPSGGSLWNQFVCHAYFGWYKGLRRGDWAWNLDADEPDVGLVLTIARQCNP